MAIVRKVETLLRMQEDGLLCKVARVYSAGLLLEEYKTDQATQPGGDCLKLIYAYTGTDNTGVYCEVANWTDVLESTADPINGPFVNQRSILVDGVDEYGSAANPASLQITNNLSIVAWVKTTDAGTNTIVSKFNSGAVQRAFVMELASSGELRVQLSSNGGAPQKNYISSAAGLDDGNWHMVAFTFGTNVLKMYIDGVLISPTMTTDLTCNSLHNSTQPVLVGANGGTTPVTHFNGNIDEVSIWDTTVLSDADITAIYNSGSPDNIQNLTVDGNLISWWRMGDKVVTFPIVPDQETGNSLTLNNMESGDIVSDAP